MIRSHLSSNIFTASVNSTSGGNAPVDSMVTRGKKEMSKFKHIFSKSFHKGTILNLKTYTDWNNYLYKTQTALRSTYCINITIPTTLIKKRKEKKKISIPTVENHLLHLLSVVL